MSQVVIENPIINSPFDEPTRHFRFTDEGITNEIVDGRRTSSYFVPIAKPKKKGASSFSFDTEWTQDRIEENKLVNDIRRRVALWRKGGYVGVTPTTARLIAYWTDPNREKKLFFCQNEALETAIYIAEVAKKYGDAWIENAIREANDTSNPGLPRTAFKMATGSGKTVVMAMLIAWHTLNKHANPQDARFSDTFLIVTPGITIRDRLRVLLPNDPENYYRQRDIVPAQLQDQLGQAKIIITNFHAFQLREKVAAGKITKSILADGQPSPFTETPDQMVRRVCRELGTKKNIIVLNDEAHHCYRRKPDGEDEALTGDDRIEAKKRDEEARIWISGIEAVKAKIGVKAIYDLSATPFFLRGSGYPEGTLFPWVVSDFSLIDAIEAGIVKVPRVPVADDSMTGDQPTYRDLWLRIREHLPKKGRKTDAVERRTEAPRRTARGAAQPLRQLREVLPPLGAERRGPRQRHHAAGVHRRLQQHQRLQAGLRLHRRLGKADRRTDDRPGRATAHLPQRRRQRRLAAPPEHDPGGQPAARIRRGDERRLQEDRRPRNRGVQGRISRPLPRPRCREPHRRRPAPRSDEHRRQGRQARRTRQVRGQRLHAHRGMGRQHRHPRSRRARLRHATALRAGGRPRSAPNELRRQRRRAISTPNTPRSTACRFPSSRAAARPQTPSPARCPPACAPSKAASPARSPFPGCSATATTWPASGSPRPSPTNPG